ncbi:hypothetical protein [Bacillus sp. FJAT-52991]|uniref:Uncharacterized protein n=1 Tax=Bacillus kandeliae TaxID=3129297 RepID=A0ABZ2N849_9BACI
MEKRKKNKKKEHQEMTTEIGATILESVLVELIVWPFRILFRIIGALVRSVVDFF